MLYPNIFPEISPALPHAADSQGEFEGSCPKPESEKFSGLESQASSRLSQQSNFLHFCGSIELETFSF